jgi:chromosome segregation protein
MKIKRVSITGFKSFVDRLEIAFPVGLSAIVGPNGCGKSNIVDAIRWAMGEQSAKTLRARQMEDVIFGGSENAKALGMAEVSILLENGGGSFPTQFAHETEVAITRRLYRSGESEYLINSVPCRLKDIQEMFMDTGLGNRAYSIIGQGKIGSIIEQKPEETRAMLEEAAGITKYKKKVEESQRKIELAQANLLRVEDILGEVERQIRSLKRQAAKAKRYKAVGQEIQRLELILNAHAFQDLKEDSGRKMKSTEDLMQEEIARSANFSSIQAKVETMNLELEAKDQEIAGLRQAYLLSKEKVNKRESMLESVAAERRMQVEMEKRLLKEKEDLGRRLEELEQEKRLLLDKIDSVKQRAMALEDEISMVEARAKNRHEFLKQVKEAFEEARTKLNSGISKEMSLNQESGYIHTRIKEVTDSRSRLEKEKEDVALKMENVLQASRRKNEAREALAQKLTDIERDIAAEQGAFNDLEETRKGLEADLRSTEADLNMNHSRLASLRSLAENFEGYKIGVRTIMKASDLEARREGRIIGLVADVIQVEPAYEQAVEAVLGDKLQYIIVETQRDGKEAIEYLKVHAKGRSTFVPIKDLTGKEEKGNHNGFPLLRDLVRVPDPYAPLMDTLFGNAALAPDLNHAISAWANNGKDQCLVTPEGDVVDRSGILSGGKVAHSSHGILARKREMNELEVKVAGLVKAAEGQKIRLQQVIGEKERREAALHSLHEEKANCQDKINDLDKVNFQLNHEADQLERMVARINSELEQKDREQTRHTEALSRIESELLACKEKREEEEAYLKQKEVELKESEEDFERFRNELSRLRMEHSLAQEEQRGLTREVERIDDFAREAQETFTRIEADIVTAREKYEDGGTREESLREELNVLYEEMRRAEEAMNWADQERNQFRNQIREEEKKGDALRGELEILKERIHTARMEQSEIGFRMDGLANMVREKYNLHLADIYKEYLQVDHSPAEVKERLEHQKKIRGRLGEVNLTAIQEHEALKERYAFITSQRQDLLDSIDSLNEAIRKINRTSIERFTETFKAVDEKLKMVFPILFNGGSAGLKLLDETKPLESGVLVEVQPPGKRLSHMGLLSGGEKALVAMALIFAIYLIKPSPFLLLDEVDAPLDEANIDRFNDLLREIRKYSQIILVTHNRRSMEIVDRLYGVTMEKQGISKIVSVNLESIRNN